MGIFRLSRALEIISLPDPCTSISPAKSYQYKKKKTNEANIDVTNYSPQQLPDDINDDQFDHEDNDHQLLKSPLRNHGISTLSVDLFYNAELSPME